MNAATLKAILAETSDFAISPTPITNDLDYYVKRASKQSSVRACPSGLIRATIVEDGHPWEERVTLHCGDRSYTVPRKNGVLVRFPKPEGVAWATVKAMPHTKVVQRDGERVIEMVVSRQAVLAPWGEYALVQAERELENERYAERQARMKAATEAIGGIDSGLYRVYGNGDGGKPKTYDFEGRDTSRGVAEYLVGKITVPLPVAEALGVIVDELRVNPVLASRLPKRLVDALATVPEPPGAEGSA